MSRVSFKGMGILNFHFVTSTLVTISLVKIPLRFIYFEILGTDTDYTLSVYMYDVLHYLRSHLITR